MDRDRACMGNKISERFLKDLAYGRMWEDDGLQLGGLHAFFDSDPGYDDQLGGRISQEVGADDRFVFSQNQLADAVALLVFSDKAAGERHRYLLDGVRSSFSLQLLFGLADTRDFGVGINNARNGFITHAAVLT